MGKGKIIVPARLEICPICQLHGKIVYSDESRSERLGSHEEDVYGPDVSLADRGAGARGRLASIARFRNPGSAKK